jgi:type VI secretion system protein ImpM
MSGATVGFFGKLPSHGDFIERRVGSAFRELWDDWMQRCIVESQQELGGRWLDCYLTSPIWRYFLCDGVAGSASYAGVLLPSVDRVGRYFPLTVVVELPSGIPAAEFAQAAADWFEEVEQLCADALQTTDFDLGAFDAALVCSAEKLSGVDQLPPALPFPGNSSQWHWPTASVNGFGAAVSAPLMGMAQSALRPMSMWWTAGSELIEPCVLLNRSLPRPDSFAALLAGTWNDGRWDGQVLPAQSEPPENLEPEPEYTIESGAASDAGTVRKENQDHFFAADDKRLWAVADGMGGHSHGEIASQMVVDALNGIEQTGSLNTALQSVSTALNAVNADLRRGAVGVADASSSGSTVVALLVKGREWAVAWAGDSRAYVWRGESLSQLTRDHSTLNEESPDGVPALAGEITRAVGGHDDLELDHVVDLVAVGDRFLLCSDGLYGALDQPALIECLRKPSAQRASDALIQAARSAGARDNVTAVVVDVKALATENPLPKDDTQIRGHTALGIF